LFEKNDQNLTRKNYRFGLDDIDPSSRMMSDDDSDRGDHTDGGKYGKNAFSKITKIQNEIDFFLDKFSHFQITTLPIPFTDITIAYSTSHTIKYFWSLCAQTTTPLSPSSLLYSYLLIKQQKDFFAGKNEQNKSNLFNLIFPFISNPQENFTNFPQIPKLQTPKSKKSTPQFLPLLDNSTYSDLHLLPDDILEQYNIPFDPFELLPTEPPPLPLKSSSRHSHSNKTTPCQSASTHRWSNRNKVVQVIGDCFV